MTLGEERVRVAFNPSRESVVDQIKQDTAVLINVCETLKILDPRLAALAQTYYELAAMWAVKAATTPPKVIDNAAKEGNKPKDVQRKHPLRSPRGKAP